MALALCGPKGPPPLVTGGALPWALSYPPPDLAVSRRDRLGVNVDEIMAGWREESGERQLSGVLDFPHTPLPILLHTSPATPPSFPLQAPIALFFAHESHTGW